MVNKPFVFFSIPLRMKSKHWFIRLLQGEGIFYLIVLAIALIASLF
jgi:hypothetical protein